MAATPARPASDTAPHVPATPLHDLMYGHLYASALRTVALYGIADLLADGPLPAEELAARSGTQAGPLRRVLRLLAMRGLFRAEADGTFSLEEGGQALRTEVPGSRRDAVLLFTDAMYRRSATGLEDTLRTGEPGFEAAYGTPFFAHLAGTPDAGRLFDTAISSLTDGVNEQIAGSYPFPDSGTVVDVAGGRGGLLRAVLDRSPGLTGVLFDRPGTVTSHLLDTGEPAGRWRTEGGDLFTAVPEGGDLYLLKNILHDWPDEDCLRILGTVRRAMAPGTRLLVIDAVLPADGTPHPAVPLDIVMLMVLHGRERTAAEFEELLSRSGFTVRRVLPTPSLTSIVEAEAV
ncbi:methyltransferase [Streptomyces monomycini]|uniref:methyltransferase n=1 Tax=Streptomyces monomycini TaxID=371720 RepID=UPI0004AB7F96|nr:methyltransferase [Streptomyces monomycini]